MRIAFVGKGGSGKTTLSALFAHHALQRYRTVLAIDADINQHLATTISPECTPPPALGEALGVIKEYLKGENPRITAGAAMIKTTPPGHGSRLLTPTENDPLLARLSATIADIHCLATGGFADEDIGTKCFHSKTGAVELLLNHLTDTREEVVIVDMTAGADSFASGLFTKFDLTCVVVEPTLKSIGVFEQYQQYAKDYGVALCAVGNKIHTDDDLHFLQSKLGEHLITHLTHSSAVRASERGEGGASQTIEAENSAALAKILEELSSNIPDRQRMYEQAVHFHRINATSWGNASTGLDLTTQIDPTFTWPNDC